MPTIKLGLRGLFALVLVGLWLSACDSEQRTAPVERSGTQPGAPSVARAAQPLSSSKDANSRLGELPDLGSMNAKGSASASPGFGSHAAALPQGARVEHDRDAGSPASQAFADAGRLAQPGPEQPKTAAASPRVSGTADSGAPDSGAPDSGAPDSGAPDSGAPDSGAPGTAAPRYYFRGECEGVFVYIVTVSVETPEESSASLSLTPSGTGRLRSVGDRIGPFEVMRIDEDWTGLNPKVWLRERDTVCYATLAGNQSRKQAAQTRATTRRKRAAASRKRAAARKRKASQQRKERKQSQARKRRNRRTQRQTREKRGG